MRDQIRNTKVEEIRTLLVKDAAVVRSEDPVDKLIDKLLENPLTRHVYVTDEEGRLKGTVRLYQIIEYIFPFETAWLQEKYNDYLQVFYRETAGELMVSDFSYVYNETTLSEMVTLMTREKISELPVVDGEMRIIGEVNFLEVLRFIRNMEKK